MISGGEKIMTLKQCADKGLDACNEFRDAISTGCGMAAAGAASDAKLQEAVGYKVTTSFKQPDFIGACKSHFDKLTTLPQTGNTQIDKIYVEAFKDEDGKFLGDDVVDDKISAAEKAMKGTKEKKIVDCTDTDNCNKKECKDKAVCNGTDDLTEKLFVKFGLFGGASYAAAAFDDPDYGDTGDSDLLSSQLFTLQGAFGVDFARGAYGFIRAQGTLIGTVLTNKNDSGNDDYSGILHVTAGIGPFLKLGGFTAGFMVHAGTALMYSVKAPTREFSGNLTDDKALGFNPYFSLLAGYTNEDFSIALELMNRWNINPIGEDVLNQYVNGGAEDQLDLMPVQVGVSGTLFF